MGLFNEGTFQEIYELFASLGLHHEEKTPQKKQVMLFAIISELTGAMNESRRTDTRRFEQDQHDKSFVIAYLTHVAGTAEEKLAWTTLQAFNFIGYWRLKKEIVEKGFKEIHAAREKGYNQSVKEITQAFDQEIRDRIKIVNPPAHAFHIIKSLTDVYYANFTSNEMGIVLGQIQLLAESMEIDLERFIQLKLLYLHQTR